MKSPLVEVSPGVWKPARTLKGQQAKRAEEIALEKGQLTHDALQLLTQLAGHPQIVRVPERIRRALAEGRSPYTPAPIALEVLRKEKVALEALVSEVATWRLLEEAGGLMKRLGQRLEKYPASVADQFEARVPRLSGDPLKHDEVRHQKEVLEGLLAELDQRERAGKLRRSD